MELKQYSRLTWGANKHILTKLLNGTVDQMLLYTAPVWWQNKWCQTKLRSIQRIILMTTIRSFKTISTLSALILSNAMPMEMRAQIQTMIAFLKRRRPFVNYHIKQSNFIPQLLQHCSIQPEKLDIPRKSYSTEHPDHSFPVSYLTEVSFHISVQETHQTSTSSRTDQRPRIALHVPQFSRT